MIKKLVAAVAVAGVGIAGVAGVAGAKGAKAPGESTIYEIVENAAMGGMPEFTYLKAALDATGLDAALDMEGVQYTVFAPTDAAFEKVAGELGFADVGELLTFLLDNELADDVLLYHAAEGRRFSNSVVNPNNDKMIETLLGAYLTATPMATVVDAAPSTSDAAITAANISASNGVIHVIDNVLVPLDV